jgi:transcriptional regulator with GAF, ATPase, and Fis domain
MHDPGASALEDRVRFEALISDIASQFVNVDSDLIDGSIEDAQRRLVEALDIDRSTLFQFVDDGSELVLTHYWARPEFPPILLPPERIAELFPYIRGRVLAGEAVSFSSVDELPADSPDREHMRQLGTKSNVSLPLVASGRVIGAVTFSAMRAERSWEPEFLTRLTLVAHVFAGALARKGAEMELRQTLDENARLRDRLLEENIYLRHQVHERGGLRETMGRSPAIRSMLAEVDQVAPTDTTVLLYGETGTGKELVANAIHERSWRRSKAMVAVNCAAIPAALVESELFGYEKGAFTGAMARQIGRFEVADRSTVFLDEIGELSTDVQAKLLRVLQEKQIHRLGSSRSIEIDVRVIAATNRDLERMVAAGSFREDLYYRLNVFPIRIPPLRERIEDIPMLAWSFVREFSKAMGKRIESIPKDRLLALQRYSWPGNVRELRNVVERAMIVSTGPRLQIEPPRATPDAARGVTRLLDVERQHIRTVLERTGWRIRGRGGAAELLDLKPSTLEGRMARLGVRRPGQ